MCLEFMLRMLMWQMWDQYSSRIRRQYSGTRAPLLPSSAGKECFEWKECELKKQIPSWPAEPRVIHQLESVAFCTLYISGNFSHSESVDQLDSSSVPADVPKGQWRCYQGLVFAGCDSLFYMPLYPKHIYSLYQPAG